MGCVEEGGGVGMVGANVMWCRVDMVDRVDRVDSVDRVDKGVMWCKVDMGR